MSLQPLKKVKYSINQFMSQYKGSKVMSFSTQVSRTNRLQAMFDELHQLGYKVRHLQFLKQKHVDALVEHWKTKQVSVGSMKNRLSDLRFVCKALRKNRLVQPNEHYQIGQRSAIPTANKAIYDPNISAINDERVRCSLELQRLFGLRAEECLKIVPVIADQGNQLFLKRSWTKGGVERFVPIHTQEQRDWLERAKHIAGQGSLIPADKTYIQQRGCYYREAKKIGLNRPHGLRHAYAQQRYKTLTGWESPVNGGPLTKTLSKEDRKLDRAARKLISIELGHSRIGVTSTYLNIRA